MQANFAMQPPLIKGANAMPMSYHEALAKGRADPTGKKYKSRLEWVAANGVIMKENSRVHIKRTTRPFGPDHFADLLLSQEETRQRLYQAAHDHTQTAQDRTARTSESDADMPPRLPTSRRLGKRKRDGNVIPEAREGITDDVEENREPEKRRPKAKQGLQLARDKIRVKEVELKRKRKIAAAPAVDRHKRASRVRHSKHDSSFPDRVVSAADGAAASTDSQHNPPTTSSTTIPTATIQTRSKHEYKSSLAHPDATASRAYGDDPVDDQRAPSRPGLVIIRLPPATLAKFSDSPTPSSKPKAVQVQDQAESGSATAKRVAIPYADEERAWLRDWFLNSYSPKAPSHQGNQLWYSLAAAFNKQFEGKSVKSSSTTRPRRTMSSLATECTRTMPSRPNRIREAKWAAEAVASDKDLDPGLSPATEQSPATRPKKTPKSISRRILASSTKAASPVQSGTATTDTDRQNDPAQPAKRGTKRKAATAEGGTSKRAKLTDTGVISQEGTSTPEPKNGAGSAGEAAPASDMAEEATNQERNQKRKRDEKDDGKDGEKDSSAPALRKKRATRRKKN